MTLNPNASLAFNQAFMAGIIGATGATEFPSVTAFLNNPTTSGNEVGYSGMAAFLASRADAVENSGVMLILDDGTVIFDSTKGPAGNTYASYKNKTVNSDNHNTRPEVLNAVLSSSGVGVAARFSSSSGSELKYLAQRMGEAPQRNLGTLRVSQRTILP